MKDGQGLNAAQGTTPICRIEVVKAGISPSLSAKSRRETYFRKNFSTRTGRTFLGPTSCCSYLTLSSGTSAVTSCASVSELIHSSSSNCFEAGSCSFFKNINCVLSRKRHSSSKSPVTDLIVSMSSSQNKLWPAPAKEMMPSRCSSRSPDSLTCGSDTCFVPALLLIALRAILYFSPNPRQSAPPRRTPH